MNYSEVKSVSGVGREPLEELLVKACRGDVDLTKEVIITASEVTDVMLLMAVRRAQLEFKQEPESPPSTSNRAQLANALTQLVLPILDTPAEFSHAREVRIEYTGPQDSKFRSGVKETPLRRSNMFESRRLLGKDRKQRIGRFDLRALKNRIGWMSMYRAMSELSVSKAEGDKLAHVLRERFIDKLVRDSIPKEVAENECDRNYLSITEVRKIRRNQALEMGSEIQFSPLAIQDAKDEIALGHISKASWIALSTLIKNKAGIITDVKAWEALIPAIREISQVEVMRLIKNEKLAADIAQSIVSKSFIAFESKAGRPFIKIFPAALKAVDSAISRVFPQ